ncbi:MAG TPA: TolC family protein [Candidatus Acidoferrales bacterium]|jgi:outer membrane protein TolC|nr:TolC family protein [Candidatus Acidoferrales bacterium]
MNSRAALLCALLSVLQIQALAAQESKPPAPRSITLEEAVQMALKHNHVVRIAGYKVEEKQHSKDAARSAYFPLLRNDSTVLNLTDTQFIGIPAGSLGVISGTSIPGRSVILNQGGTTLITSGTSLTQPLSELLRIKPANDIASAELRATRGRERQTENEVALKVHQLYYRILIVQSHREAMQARIQAADDLQKERLAQVKFGSALEEESIDSRAQTLEAKQDLLSTELQLSDLTMQLDDAIGLPLTTPLTLDASVRQVGESCEREACLRVALESHPEIAEARAEIEKASAAVTLAKRQYIPDVEAFARYSYQDNVPFLARNFGSFGLHFGYDLFDGGRRAAAIGEHKAQLAQAEENLARIKEEVELHVQTAWNKLERTRQMVKVSEELLTLRTESRRVSAQQLQQGAALRSQADAAAAHELDAKTLLLQSQLDYIQARDEMTEAMGQTPE